MKDSNPGPPSHGFTLIELIVVTVIIGVLVTIAIVRFTSTKEKALDAAAQSDLRNAMSIEEAFFADSSYYVTFSVIEGAGVTSPVEFHASPGVTVSMTGGAGGYAGTARHSGSGNTWCVDSSNGVIVEASTC